MINRRQFLKSMFAAGTGACCAAAFGNQKDPFAWAQTSGGSGRSLVLFNQFGGCDPLNSFTIPVGVAEYYEKRNSIAIPADAILPLNGSIGFHPSLSNLKRIFDEENCAVIKFIGDPVGTRSHFTAQDIYSRGTTSDQDRRGWLGRLGDTYFQTEKFSTIGLGTGPKLDFLSNREENRPLVAGSLGALTYRPGATRDGGIPVIGDNALRQEILGKITGRDYQDDSSIRKEVDLGHKTTQSSVNDIQAAISAYEPTGDYGTDGAARYLREVSTLISGGFSTRVFYGGMGGWDNHAGQGGIEGTQAGILALVDMAIGAFEADMKAIGKWDSTAICVFTEFGRKTFENGSGGTDHGWGSAMLVIGGGVNGGVKGPEIDADTFSEEWLPQRIDFRNAFSEMVSWLGFNPAPVFPESFEKETLGLFS